MRGICVEEVPIVMRVCVERCLLGVEGVVER